MMSELKTLIVLDTNKLRSIIRGEVHYASFSFSSEFEDLKSFIEEKKLEENVHIAIPQMAIDELLRQKIEKYLEDRENLSNIIQRLSQLPQTDFDSINLPDDNFNCEEHLKPLAGDYLKQEDIKIIGLPEDKLAEIFKNIINRALERKTPFKQSKKSKDKGFKDVVIWESLLNYDEINDYDKIIFISQDNDFQGCDEEFEAKTSKYFSLSSSTAFAEEELLEDYRELIEKRNWYDFVNSDYFKDYISQFISKIGKITIEDVEYEFGYDTVVDYIDLIEQLDEEEDTGISTIIVTLLKGTVERDGHETEVFLKIKTYLDDTKGIQDTDFEVFKDE